MDPQKRLELLEEIGRGLNDISTADTKISSVEVVFWNDAGDARDFSLEDAICHLAGDVYLFEDFDLRDADGVEVHII